MFIDQFFYQVIESIIFQSVSYGTLSCEILREKISMIIFILRFSILYCPSHIYNTYEYIISAEKF